MKIKSEIKELSKEIYETISLLNKFKMQKNYEFYKLCSTSISAIKKNKKILFFGNGGSASDAQHLATELTVRFEKNRKALPAISLVTDTSTLTAIGNDFHFKKIFSRQIEAIGQKGDVAIGITTSGNSPNIIEAYKQCKKSGLHFFALSGNGGGKLKKYTKNIILIPSKITSKIQTAEILIGQVFCKILEKKLT
jgi:D-sedoheptulose 7-phosphate isomerase